MKKTIIIGCPGSGKSTFGRALSKVTGIPLYHLDMLYWNADKTTVSKAVFSERLFEVMKKDEWIIDGNYSSTMELRFSFADTVFFLDYPTNICVDGIISRTGRPRSDMPWIEMGEPDSEFIDFVKNYNKDQRPKVFELIEKYKDKEIYIFTNRKEADMFLVSQKATT